MSTVIRPEISEKRTYWIPKHRYYELKHFCLQYDDWKKAYLAADIYSRHPREMERLSKTNLPGNPTAKLAEMRVYYKNRMDMIERCCFETDKLIGDYIFEAVTEGVSYDVLRARYSIPCSKDIYYDLYRKFFWLLSQERK